MKFIFIAAAAASTAGGKTNEKFIWTKSGMQN